MQPDTSALKFPCDFPIKIIGLANDEFEAAALSIIHEHVPDLAETALRSRLSKDEKYLALTVLVTATSKEQLDGIYHALTACKLVLMAL